MGRDANAPARLSFFRSNHLHDDLEKGSFARRFRIRLSKQKSSEVGEVQFQQLHVGISSRSAIRSAGQPITSISARCPLACAGGSEDCICARGPRHGARAEDCVWAHCDAPCLEPGFDLRERTEQVRVLHRYSLEHDWHA